MDGDFNQTELRAEIERFRQNGGLAATTPLRRLFDFLAEWSLLQKPVAEIDIAIEVFRRSTSEPGDASVRVYVHRLRKKLEDYYAQQGAASGNRLVIPRGEYRLALSANVIAGVEDKSLLNRRMLMRGGLSAVALAAAGGAGALVALTGPWNKDAYAAVRSSPVWSEVVANPRPIYLVLGDYYIFGESDGADGISRLVREFDVDSHIELGDFVDKHPQYANRYVDLNLSYLPIGAALGLKNLLPFLKSIARGPDLNILVASELKPEMLGSGHIVYVGYLSGLGKLEDTVFNGARFKVAEDYPIGTKVYDEIFDTKTSNLFPSQAGRPKAGRVHTDYGYLSSFATPNGNRIVVLAGTRDVGVMHVTEVATDPAALRELSRNVGKANSVEAVYNVQGMEHSTLMGTLVPGTAVPRADMKARPDG